MSRLIIKHVQRLTSTVKNQCLGTEKNIAQSHFSKIYRHFSSVIDDDQLEDKGIFTCVKFVQLLLMYEIVLLTRIYQA